MNQDIIDRMVAADIALSVAQGVVQKHTQLLAAANISLSVSKLAATLAASAYNSAVIVASVNQPIPIGEVTHSPLDEDNEENEECFYYCDICHRQGIPAAHDTETHASLTPCERCDKLDGAYKAKCTDVYPSYWLPTYCEACWTWALQPGNAEVCSECNVLLEEYDTSNFYNQGRCSSCAGSPCHHCGIQGGH